MRREPHVRFCERAAVKFHRATYLICHCKSAEEARALWGAIADRFAVCKLVLHPQKTTIVYCKDVNRRGDFPNIHFDFLGFQFRARKIMWVKRDRRIFAHSFQPAASPKALTRISREISKLGATSPHRQVPTANPAFWNSRVLCAGYRLQRNPQFAHVAGGLSDLSARRNA